ncbi:Ig-like domain-containing protein, partial [Neobacillus drentensis]
TAENRVNYKLNGYIVNGTPKLSANGKVVTIKLFSAMNDGDNKLSVADIKDYNNMNIINVTDQVFNVVKDTQAPTIDSVVSASLDYVTVKFSEELDSDSVDGLNVYWSDNSGTTKHKAAKSVVSIDSQTFKFDFTGDRLPARATTLYVDKVTDLSGNAIASGSK